MLYLHDIIVVFLRCLRPRFSTLLTKGLTEILRQDPHSFLTRLSQCSLCICASTCCATSSHCDLEATAQNVSIFCTSHNCGLVNKL